MLEEKRTAKKALKQAMGVIIPILLYGTYGYFTKEWAFEWGAYRTESNSLYGRAANAISNSSMASCYKDQALRELKSNKPDAYYEAVIAIANGDMSSCYKASAISGLGRQF